MDYVYLSRQQRRTRILSELENSKINGQDFKDNVHVISGQRFSLQFHGVNICPEAFAKVHGVSLDLMEHLVRQGSHVGSKV